MKNKTNNINKDFIELQNVKFYKDYEEVIRSQKKNRPMMKMTVYTTQNKQFGNVILPPKFTKRGGVVRKNKNHEPIELNALGDGAKCTYGTQTSKLAPSNFTVLDILESNDDKSKVLSSLRNPNSVPLESVVIGSSKNFPLTFAFDAEWQALDYSISHGVDFKTNYILSYQFSCYLNGSVYLFLFEYPTDYTVLNKIINVSRYKQHRLAFNTVISYMIKYLKEAGVLDVNLLTKAEFKLLEKDKKDKIVNKKMKITPLVVNKKDLPKRKPLYIQIVAHAGKGDLSSFYKARSNVFYPVKYTQNINGGMISVRPKLSDIWYPDRNYMLSVVYSFRDTIALAPNGFKGLNNLSNLLGLEKVKLGEGVISKMFNLKNNNHDKFVEYSLSDALITLLYTINLAGCNNPLPLTLASAGADYAFNYLIAKFFDGSVSEYNRVFRGLQKVNHGKEEILNKHNKIVFFDKKSLEPVNAFADTVLRMASKSYAGGYNQSFTNGFVGVPTFDYDLKGAYPTALAMIADVDYSVNGRVINDRELDLSYFSDIRIPFFAQVDVEFPKSVKFPCIPVQYEGALVYPRVIRGAYVTTPEVVLALKLGAKVHCIYGVMPKPLYDDMGNLKSSMAYVLKDFLLDRDHAKRVYGSGSMHEKLIKDMTNSVYGKTVQGIVDSRAYNPLYNRSEELGMCKLTNPVVASMTTAMVRCVLVATMNELDILGFQSYSATTDGFICNAPENIVYGSKGYGFTQLFANSRAYLTDNPDVWEIKHNQDCFFNICTRGNVAPNFGGVFARNGYKTEIDPKIDNIGARMEFIDKVLTRKGSIKMEYSLWQSHRELCMTEGDFMPELVERRLRMDYDYKRKPVIDSVTDVSFNLYNKNYNHVCFETLPFESIDEFINFRKARESMPVICTKDHVLTVEAKAINNHTGKGAEIGKDKERSILISILRAYRGAIIDIPVFNTLKGAEIIDLINYFKLTRRKLTYNDYKHAGRIDRQKNILPYILMEDILDIFLALKDDEAKNLVDLYRKELKEEERKKERRKAKTSHFKE